MPHRILIIDDDPEVLNTLVAYLGDGLGYHVETAPNGQQALELAMNAPPFDLAIIDVRMPGISGTETYMRLKNMSPEMEALFFTADQDFEKTLDFMRFSLPPERVLTKPLNDLSLLTRLIIGILGPPAC